MHVRGRNLRQTQATHIQALLEGRLVDGQEDHSSPPPPDSSEQTFRELDQDALGPLPPPKSSERTCRAPGQDSAPGHAGPRPNPQLAFDVAIANAMDDHSHGVAPPCPSLKIPVSPGARVPSYNTILYAIVRAAGPEGIELEEIRTQAECAWQAYSTSAQCARDM